MIKTVADTIADAVRLAVRDDSPNYWALHLEDGSLKQAVIRNRITFNVAKSDAFRMELCTKYGRMWQA